MIKQLKVNRRVAGAACSVMLATLGVLATTAVPAHAATSESDAWWNDAPVAKAWFNSGNSNPSKGPNSFTIKVESAGNYAKLFYWINGVPQNAVAVWGSGNEMTFSVAPSPTTVRQITFSVCGTVGNNVYCDQNLHYDTIQQRAGGENGGGGLLAKVILTALCGYGHVDMLAYERYLSGEMTDFELPQDRIDAALAAPPRVP